MEKKNEKQNNEMKSEVKVISDAEVSVRLRMPMKQWVIWNDDCEMTYRGCRWMKMWNDHLQSQNIQVTEDLFVKYLGEKAEKLKEARQEKESLGTFGEKKGDE